MDEVSRFLSYLMLENFSYVNYENSPYSLRDEWTELDKFCFRKERLPLLFATLPEFITRNLNIVRPRLAADGTDRT